MPNTQGWISENEARAFPFSADNDPGNHPPEDLLVDLRLFLSANDEVEIYISTLSYDSTADAYTLVFSSVESGVTLLTFTINRLDSGQSRVGKKITAGSGSTIAFFTPGPQWDDPTWVSSGSWTKNWSSIQSAVEPCTLWPGPSTFRRVLIDGTPSPDSDALSFGATQTLIGGYNFGISVAAPRLGSGTDGDTLELTAGPGLGAGFAPVTPDSYIATINGVSPDSKGNINIAAKDCLQIAQPVAGEALIDNTLQLSSNCSPCCSCESYLKVSRAIGRRSAKLKDINLELIQVLTDSVTTYNKAAAAMNAVALPVVTARPSDASSSSVMFVVVNGSRIPAFAYVAVKVVFGSLTPVSSFTIATSPGCSAVPLTGTSFSATVDAVRTALPDQPATSLDQGLNAFPSNIPNDQTFIVRVDSASTTTAPLPMAPGEMRVISLSFPKVYSHLSEIPNDWLANTEIYSSVTIGLRTVAVFGAAHSYIPVGDSYSQVFPIYS